MFQLAQQSQLLFMQTKINAKLCQTTMNKTILLSMYYIEFMPRVFINDFEVISFILYSNT